MPETPAAAETELLRRMAADPGSEPGIYECLACFVARRVVDRGCDHSRSWTQWFRDLKSPTATGLDARLAAIGVRCDCELTTRGYRLARHLLVRDLATDELAPPAELPDCAGVRRTSTRPCADWERRS